MNIRILATSDLHMNLNGFDFYTDTPDPSIGFTRTASLIRLARQQAEASGALVLLFDNGDSLQGTPMGDWAVERANAPHILMQAFAELRYDAIGLGNHDFGFGLGVLDRVLADAPCPVICSNAYRQDATQVWQNLSVLHRTFHKNGQQIPLKIGVFSVLPPQTAKWEAHRLQEAVVMEDILECAHEKVQDLQAHGCDLILALAHTGLGATEAQSDLENAIIPLAAIDGIDALIAGHSHLTFPGKSHAGLEHVDAIKGRVHGKPVVMPGSAGSHLGVIDLTLRTTKRGNWSVQTHSAELRPVCHANPNGPPEPVVEDPDLVILFTSGHTETRRRTAEPVGHIDQHLHSYFSFCARDRGLALVAAAQAAVLRPYLQGSPIAELPVLSATSPCKFGGRAGPRFFTDVPAGKICLRHVTDLYVFPNELQAVVVSGEQIRDWLEMSAGIFNQIAPGTSSDLVDPNRAGHNFDVLHGLTYRIDLSQPPRFETNGRLVNPAHYRVQDIRFNDAPVTANQHFVVALNNYRASGGGHFPFVGHAKPIALPALPMQRVLQDYLSGILPRDPLENAPRPFRLASVPGASAILKTGPKARQHLAELNVYDPYIVGEDEDGFLQIRLTF
ncbi:bifunctional 2',3'-cyclic-nucleotide 2'-phosphodiesterase/3'-nucleotidase [Ruegeria lacuscaerulensis]|uniref:bifunctional 2',3'-cyclic-nucleotide 2'-phosphodiesterase/3'-nucleotidase n=1 Tax=Ruegeria lacuscaerulensis TaxID=55218 RepID=UPI00147C050E|nr:bifunctional 2',3'-cyclic-nucleotide 2'-phosphodiesterase/3'-nucleotidase [Ruegeria lacuscaerulensis]